MFKIIIYSVITIILHYYSDLLAQEQGDDLPMPQMGGNFRPNYESYRLDKLIEVNDVSYSGDLNFSIPLLSVPGRHGHNFDIKLTYNSNIRQRQFASWVGIGWNLEIGSIERTVNGRTDEPSHLDGSLLYPGGNNRGVLGGRFIDNFLGMTITDRDIADQYQLSIDGGSMQIIPFPHSITDSTQFSSVIDFLPPQYKPWKIQATYESNEELTEFTVIKEDGTRYTFGGDNENIEWLEVKAEDLNPEYQQEYRFPYRWNL